MLRRFRDWVRPGGQVCIYTDSLMALVLELIRIGRSEEALRRLEIGRGVFSQGDATAELHQADRRALEDLFAAAGLVDVTCHGLLVTATAWEKTRCTEALLADEAAFLGLERRLMADPALVMTETVSFTKPLFFQARAIRQLTIKSCLSLGRWPLF